MHSIKGGWVGQTFALAKCNGSEGKKSRIRRSKKDRKAMVESFIKKYQSSNSGSFPSLNLTHKEVGGSFYTVREIVREIIQENRVLGPAKLTSEELNTNQLDEQFPLGSVSIEPQIPLYVTSNGSHFAPNHHPGTSEELLSISDGLCNEHENQRIDNVQIINGSRVDVRIEESAEQVCEELQTSESSKAEKRAESLAAFTDEVTHITEDIVVETFPLRPIPKAADCSDARSGEVKNLTKASQEIEIEEVDLEPGNGSFLLHRLNSLGNSGLVDEKKDESLSGLLLDRNSGLVDKEGIPNIGDGHLKNSNCSTTGDTASHTMVGTDVDVGVPHNDFLQSKINEKSYGIDGNMAINAPNGKSPNGTCGGGSSSREETRTSEATVTENEADAQCKESSPKGSNPTLDRINLESWEGASSGSDETGTNPLWAVFKSFMTAFMKFWSE